MSMIHKIDADCYVHSIFAKGIDLSFNQYVTSAEDGGLLLVETGFRRDYSKLRMALEAENMQPSSIRAVVVPHFEADEMGALELVLKDAPQAIVYAHPICAHGLEDVFGIKVVRAKHMDSFKFAQRTFRFIHTPHVHQWDSMVLLDEAKARLFCSDLFIQSGPCRGLLFEDQTDLVLAAIHSEGYLPSQAHLRSAMSRLRDQKIDSVMPMHGSPLAGHVDRYVEALSSVQLDVP